MGSPKQVPRYRRIQETIFGSVSKEVGQTLMELAEAHKMLGNVEKQKEVRDFCRNSWKLFSPATIDIVSSRFTRPGGVPLDYPSRFIRPFCVPRLSVPLHPSRRPSIIRPASSVPGSRFIRRASSDPAASLDHRSRFIRPGVPRSAWCWF